MAKNETTDAVQKSMEEVGTAAVAVPEVPGVWAGEAPFSVNWKMRSDKGVAFQFTARGFDFEMAYTQVKLGFKQLMQDGFVPLTSDTKDKVTAEGKEDTKECPIHKVPMRLFTKGDRSWYSHQTEDSRYEKGWCSGRPPKNA